MIIIVLIILFLIWSFNSADVGSAFRDDSRDEREIKIAGKVGENQADNDIRRYLNRDDYLLSNINISIDEGKTEIDKIVVNRDGVFIFEVKRFVGKLYGNEDDYEWEKQKRTNAGNIYEKTVRNPIKQVKREVYLLSKYLKGRQINVWIDGYVYMVNGNGPCKSDCLINHPYEIEPIIHNGNNSLTEETINRIVDLLK